MVPINIYLQLLIYAVYGSVTEAFLCWLYNVIAINTVFKYFASDRNPVASPVGSALTATDGLVNYGEKLTPVLLVVAMVRKILTVT